MNTIRKQCAAAILLLAAVPLLAQDPARSLAEGYASISYAHVYDINRELASARFSGRLTGSEGYTEAARWMASLLASWGIRPYDTKNGYLQPFAAPYTLVKQASMTLVLPASGDGAKERAMSLEYEKDFLPMLSTDSGNEEADLVFVGWGVSAPELGYDDYAGIDVRNRIVLCFRGTPQREDTLLAPFDTHRKRFSTAKGKGALALFYVYETPIANPNADWIGQFTPAVLSYRIMDSVLAEKGMKTSALRDSLAKHPISFLLKSRIRYAVRAEHHPEGTGYNILGYLEGSDPLMKRECIVIGAHLDHCGLQGNVLFPGANDNASGSAVVAEIARAFSKMTPPRRSVVFAFFGGEEMGLLGSYFMTANLPEKFSRVAGMLNFDMTGEGDGAWCGFSEKDSVLRSFVDSADAKLKIVRGTDPIKQVRGQGGTDFAPFFKKGIPCVTFSSNGPHLAYHRSGDTIYRINPDILADIARVGFLTAVNMANRPEAIGP